jgi:ABC transporter family protein
VRETAVAALRVGTGFVFLRAFLDKAFVLHYSTPTARCDRRRRCAPVFHGSMYGNTRAVATVVVPGRSGAGSPVGSAHCGAGSGRDCAVSPDTTRRDHSLGTAEKADKVSGRSALGAPRRAGSAGGMTREAVATGEPGMVVAQPGSASRAVGVTKVYGRGETAVTVLDGVSVEFAAGRFTAVMGPSGSGKSTLPHCMAGLDRVTAGEVWIGQTELSRLSERELTLLRRERIGFVFQAYNLLPTLTAAANSRPTRSTNCSRCSTPCWCSQW